MSTSGGGQRSSRARDRRSAADFLRGIGGGLFFMVPTFMTMELWWAGFQMPDWRMLIFFVANFGVLLILEHYAGYRPSRTVGQDAVDAVIALGLGLALSAVMLALFGLLAAPMSPREIVGKIFLEAMPASTGISVAMSQLGERNPEAERRKAREGYWGSEAIALAGAFFFAYSIAPTQEPMLIGLKVSSFQALLILLLSLALSHALLYAANFQGSSRIPKGRSWWGVLLRESVSHYALALLLALFALWVFGRIDADTGAATALHAVVVLGFVTSLGAAAANLIL